MASVTGMTADAINALMDDMVVAVRVEENGQLIYTRRSGEEENAGNLVESDSAVNQAYPVGSLYFSTVPTNPNTLLGVGTWVRYAKGRTLIGLDEAQTEFDAVDETGGAKEVTLTTQQIPAHHHDIGAHTHTLPQHSHTVTASYDVDQAAESASHTRIDNWYFGHTSGDIDRSGTTGLSPADQVTGASSEGVSGDVGGGLAHPNLPPYVVVYIWRRTN